MLLSALDFTFRQYITGRMFNQTTFQCKQQKAFINTLMTEMVFFTQHVLKHNEVSSPNQNILSLREKQSFKQPLIGYLVA